MAKSSDRTDVEIREGFLCPICKDDLKTFDRLHEHFEIAHSSEDNVVLQSLKDFIGKAKRKILKQDVANNEDEEKTNFDNLELHSASSDSSFEFMQSQEIGAKCSHTQSFKKLRDKKIDRYVIEANKLLIRLKKLICDTSDDPEKRKDFEKSIVPWVKDTDVPLCPGCAKSFGLSRRRHHCRLCGGVMCHSCSLFINYEFARKLTLSVVTTDPHLPQKTHVPSRKPSTSSLMSVVNLSTEPLIRICKDCNLLLKRQETLAEQKSYRPVIVQMYEKLRECMNEIEKLVVIYMEKIDSVILGETNCGLQDIQEIKVKILKIAERIDSLSKRITKLETSEEPNGRELQLHSGIRMAASQFLRSIVLGLPPVPSQEEVSQYQKQRQDQVQKRIQEEKRAEMDFQNKKEKRAEMDLQNKKDNSSSKPTTTSNTSHRHHQPKELVSPDTGWCASPSSVQKDLDPMQQQINIIRNYIEQARTDQKYDEVQMLESNLKDLMREHKISKYISK